MTTVDASSTDQTDNRAKRNVAVLVIAQAILGAQLPMVFTVGGLAGQSLASNICLERTKKCAVIVLLRTLDITVFFPLSEH